MSAPLGGLPVALAMGAGTALGGDLLLVFPVVCPTRPGLAVWNALAALAAR